MRVTLKRADFYARAALKVAMETNYHEAKVSLSIYAPELADRTVLAAAEPIVARARDKLMEQHQLALDLIAACYAIRRQLADSNARLGISDNLTRNAQLGAEEGRLRALLKATEPVDGDDASLAVAMAKAAAQRTQPKDAYGFGRGDTVKVSLQDEAAVERLRRQLKRIADDRADINGLLTLANVSNLLTLDAATVLTLQQADLLPADLLVA
jgi:hypothetical protein